MDVSKKKEVIISVARELARLISEVKESNVEVEVRNTDSTGKIIPNIVVTFREEEDVLCTPDLKS
jgi:hypothetical protein